MSIVKVDEKGFVKPNAVDDFYRVGLVIGQGTFGTVRLAKRRADNTQWAVKIMDQNRLTKEDIEGLVSEIAIVKDIRHANIVRVLECFDDGTEKFVMVMELMRGGELLDRIITRKVYAEKNAAEVIRDVASALSYCHERNVAHRDVKPENLLLVSEDSETVKLADFGFAKVRVAKDSLNTACGTPGYAAPELLTRKKQKNYTLKVDMWSVGIVLYILLCGFPPFHEENTAMLYRKILKGAYTFPAKYFRQVSDGAKDLVRKLLVVDAESRLSAAEVLQHPWIVEQCEMDGRSSNSLATVPGELAKYVELRKKMRKAVNKIRVMRAISTAVVVMSASRRNLLAPAQTEGGWVEEEGGGGGGGASASTPKGEGTTAKVAPEGGSGEKVQSKCAIL